MGEQQRSGWRKQQGGGWVVGLNKNEAAWVEEEGHVIDWICSSQGSEQVGEERAMQSMLG